MGLRAGYGKGGSLSYDPEGKSPGWDPCKGKKGGFGSGMGVGGFAEAMAALGPLSAGVHGEAGSNVESPGGLMPYGYAGAAAADVGSLRLRGVAAVGGQLTFY